MRINEALILDVNEIIEADLDIEHFLGEEGIIFRLWLNKNPLSETEISYADLWKKLEKFSHP